MEKAERATELTHGLDSSSRRQTLRRIGGLGAGIGLSGYLPGCTTIAQKGNETPVTIAEAAARLRDGSLSSVALTTTCLQRIRELEPKLNAFITITEDLALSTAAALDAELKAGKSRGPLHGIPIVYKDNCDTAGIRTTVGSEFFSRRVPREDATIVQKLKNAGTVMLGKTDLNEFAAGGPGGYNKFYGSTHNPWNLEYESGGSSSGSGAAVAARLCMAGIGTDTGGSLRGPASRMGVVGIRPTFGRVSVAGIYPRSYSLDCCGSLTRTVADAAIMLTAMAGHDPRDKYSLDVPVEDFSAGLNRGVRGLRVGIVENYTFRDVDADVVEGVRKAIDVFAGLGAEIKTVKIPLLGGKIDYSYPLNILLYEFNQILGNEYRTANRNLFGPVVQNDMEQAAKITKATYENALAERPLQIKQILSAFNEIDVLVMPTMPTVAPPLKNPDLSGRHRQFTIPISFVGLPAISVSCGFNPAGLPIGLEIVANNLQEALLFRVAAAHERATGFHNQCPSIAACS